MSPSWLVIGRYSLKWPNSIYGKTNQHSCKNPHFRGTHELKWNSHVDVFTMWWPDDAATALYFPGLSTLGIPTFIIIFFIHENCTSWKYIHIYCWNLQSYPHRIGSWENFNRKARSIRLRFSLKPMISLTMFLQKRVASVSNSRLPRHRRR